MVRRAKQNVGKKAVTLHLEPEQHARLKALAKHDERSVAIYARRVIQAHIALYEEEQGDAPATTPAVRDADLPPLT